MIPGKHHHITFIYKIILACTDYLDVRDITTATVLRFSLSNAVIQDRKWSIKITYIPCDQYSEYLNICQEI